jgi:type VI protein secretion system component VasK
MLLGIVFPVFGSAGGLSRARRWALHLALATAVLVGLWYLGRVLDLERVLHSPWPALHKVWLPLLFFLFYLLSWLGYCLWRILGLERPAAEFPEIDAAWAEGMRALDQAGISVDEVPLFLILGRPVTGEHSLFKAAGMTPAVDATPSHPDAPLRIVASRDAVFVSCAASALLGRQATLLGEHADERLLDPLSARLGHLCRLIAARRRPYCPINGVVLLIPWSATADDAWANQVAALAQRDVRTVREILRLDCPFFVLACDLETAAGVREFIEHVPEEERLRLLGRRFPLMPDVDPHEIQDVLERGAASLGQDVLPQMIMQMLRHDEAVEIPGRPSASVRANARLIQTLAHLRQGCRRLGRILYQATQIEPGTPPMIAGCYLAATGADVLHEQAFVAGVFQELLQNQNFVAWSGQALAEEANYRRLTRLGYLGLSTLVLGTLGLVVARGA